MDHRAKNNIVIRDDEFIINTLTRVSSGSSSWTTPSSLTAVLTPTGVKLDWISTGTIEVWSSADGASYALLNTTADGIQTDNDTSLSGVNMLYKVRVVKGAKYSGFSNIVSIALTPAVLNPVYWWDYADATKVTVTGQGISEIVSKGLNNLSLVQATDADRPLWTNNNCADIDGTSDYLGGVLTAVAQPFTLITDCEPAIGETAGFIVTYAGGGRMLKLAASLWVIGNGTLLNSVTSALAGVRKNIYSIGSGADSKIFIDGTVNKTGDSGIGVFDGNIKVGRNEFANNYFAGKVFEIVVLASEISAGQSAWYQKYYQRRKNQIAGESVIQDTWIVAGQSNATANALVAEQTIPGYSAKFTSKGYVWNNVNGVVELIDPAFNCGPTYTTPLMLNHCGPGVAFAKDMNGTYTLNQLIVKYTEGATALKQNATTPDWSELSTDELLDRLKARITSANLYLNSIGKKMRIRGFFWVQGENDMAYIAEYKQNLINMFGNVESHCQAINVANGYTVSMIRIVSRISDLQTALGAGVTAMQAEQTAFISENGGILIDTDSYPCAVDNIHFTADSIITMGKDAKLAVDALGYTE